MSLFHGRVCAAYLLAKDLEHISHENGFSLVSATASQRHPGPGSLENRGYWLLGGLTRAEMALQMLQAREGPVAVFA